MLDVPGLMLEVFFNTEFSLFVVEFTRSSKQITHSFFATTIQSHGFGSFNHLGTLMNSVSQLYSIF